MPLIQKFNELLIRIVWGWSCPFCQKKKKNKVYGKTPLNMERGGNFPKYVLSGKKNDAFNPKV